MHQRSGDPVSGATRDTVQNDVWDGGTY